MPDAVRVVVVDDHPVFRLGMTALLGSLPDVDVIGEADNAADAVSAVDELPLVDDLEPEPRLSVL